MGAAKFPEEIVERYVESDFSGSGSFGQSSREPECARPRLRYCPLCFEGFLEEADLDDHVARSHGKQHVYLKVNGRIVRDVCWLKQPLEECLLVLLQVPSLNVAIQANDEEKRLTIDQTTSLMGHLSGKRAEGVIRIRTQGGPFSRTFTIYSGRQPKFQAKRLDRKMAGLMARMTRHGENLVCFRDKCRKEGLNDLESRYLDGVIEYCHGWQLEKDYERLLARGRIEASMDLLMPFHTELAGDLRCALALRMNCFAGQWGCQADSPFRMAEEFFCRNPRIEKVPEGGMRRSNIPLDPNSELFLEALRAYDSKDDGRVFDALNVLKTGGRVRDRNDEDKLNLIEARTKARLGDRLGAASLFELFLGHPLFDEEAQSQLAV